MYNFRLCNSRSPYTENIIKNNVSFVSSCDISTELHERISFYAFWIYRGQHLEVSDAVQSRQSFMSNARKFTICHIQFENFLGGDTPEPPLREGATPSRTHPPDGLWRFAPPAVRRPLRGRLF